MSRARSHPPTLLTIARRALEAHRLVARGEPLLVAVSGGPDSNALLHVLARLRAPFAFTLVAHGVDHGLRPEASAELDLAQSLASSLRVPFARTRLALEAGGNLHHRARAARYEALEAAARRAGASSIATAHHRDDRAETVLLRLLRGAGPHGLAVLPPTATFASGVRRIRPFLEASREDVRAHLARHALPFAEDPSNRDPRFLRSRIRHELLPLLTDLNGGIVGHLCHLADRLAELEPRDAPPLGDLLVAYDLTPEALPRATRLALRRVLAPGRSNASPAQIALPGGLVATRIREHVHVARRTGGAYAGPRSRNISPTVSLTASPTVSLTTAPTAAPDAPLGAVYAVDRTPARNRDVSHTATCSGTTGGQTPNGPDPPRAQPGDDPRALGGQLDRGRAAGSRSDS